MTTKTKAAQFVVCVVVSSQTCLQAPRNNLKKKALLRAALLERNSSSSVLLVTLDIRYGPVTALFAFPQGPQAYGFRQMVPLISKVNNVKPSSLLPHGPCGAALLVPAVRVVGSTAAQAYFLAFPALRLLRSCREW